MRVGAHRKGELLVARADASPSAGTGHFMRVLALAQAWLDDGGKVRWLAATAPDSLVARVAREGIEIRPVEVEAGSPADGAVLQKAVRASRATAAVVDGISFGPAFLGELGDVAGRVLLIDDLAGLPSYPVGYVLNQNAHADRVAYPPDASCRFLLGTRYVLLRREFAPDPLRRPVPDRVRRLIVTFGGADPARMTARALTALGRLEEAQRGGLEVRVLVGAANPHAAEIAGAASALRGRLAVTVLHAVSDMPVQLAWADLAVTSGGSTVWELARMGCPAIVVETVPAEERLVEGLARVGLFARLGHERSLSEDVLAGEIATRIDDPAWRGSMAELGRRLVDGAGARRVAAVVSGREATADATA